MGGQDLRPHGARGAAFGQGLTGNLARQPAWDIRLLEGSTFSAQLGRAISRFPTGSRGSAGSNTFLRCPDHTLKLLPNCLRLQPPLDEVADPHDNQ